MAKAIIKNIGVRIKIEVGIALADATTLEMRFVNPDGISGKFTGIYLFENSKHYVYYVTAATTDIPVAGPWVFQIYAVGPSYEYYGEDTSYRFYDELEGDFT